MKCRNVDIIFSFQVFCGKIPKEVFEDELILLFEKSGKIYDLRLMMDPMTGTNRGYAFITYTTKEEAEQAHKDVSVFSNLFYVSFPISEVWCGFVSFPRHGKLNFSKLLSIPIPEYLTIMSSKSQLLMPFECCISSKLFFSSVSYFLFLNCSRSKILNCTEK